MNYKAMSYAETSFTLFAFKRILRDTSQLTPVMVQFYERSVIILKEKLLKFESDEKDKRSYGDRARDRLSEIPATWPDN